MRRFIVVSLHGTRVFAGNGNSFTTFGQFFLIARPAAKNHAVKKFCHLRLHALSVHHSSPVVAQQNRSANILYLPPKVNIYCPNGLCKCPNGLFLGQTGFRHAPSFACCACVHNSSSRITPEQFSKKQRCALHTTRAQHTEHSVKLLLLCT